jgi:hypothetical protein
MNSSYVLALIASANMPQDFEESFGETLPGKSEALSPLQYPQSLVEYPKGRIEFSGDEVATGSITVASKVHQKSVDGKDNEMALMRK